MNSLNFLKKYFDISLPNQLLTSGSKKIIETMVMQMKKAVEHPIQIVEHIIDRVEDIRGDDYDYMIDEVKHELSQKRKIGKKYSFVIGSRNIDIYAIYPGKSFTQKHYAYIDAAVKKMYVWLYVASYYAAASCSPHLTIYWYLADAKKMLPKHKDEMIDRQHVNTGFTRACPAHKNSIYIFRKEEWFKVFIHESFHSLGLDFAGMPEEQANQAIFSIFPVHCDLRFSEAYTEAWAEIIHVVFISVSQYPCKYPEMNIDQLSNTIQKKMELERRWSIFQLAKVLNHNGFRYSHLFSNGNTIKKPSDWKEGSNVFSYYVLKSIFIFFYNDFMEWCGTIAFKQTQENILRLVGFIRKNYRNPEYMRIIGEFETRLDAVPDDVVMKTLKMCINE